MAWAILDSRTATLSGWFMIIYLGNLGGMPQSPSFNKYSNNNRNLPKLKSASLICKMEPDHVKQLK